MPELDVESLVDQVSMLGLVSRDRMREAAADAEDSSPDAVLRMLLPRVGSRAGRSNGSARGTRRASSTARPRRCSTWRRGRSPGSTAASTRQRPGPGDQGAQAAVRAAPRGRLPLPQGGRGRHAAPPSQHRPDHRRRPAGQPPLHDHGVRRGDEPPRLPQVAHADEGAPGAPLDDRAGRGAKVFQRAGRHPPRHQGDQHPDLQFGGRQAGQLRPGHHRGGREQARRQEPAHRRLLGAGADLQEPQGRHPLGHLLPRLRVLPDGDGPAPHGGIREQGHAQEDAGPILRRDQADRRPSPMPPTRSCRRSSTR